MLNFNWLADLSDAWGRFLVILAFIAPMIFALIIVCSCNYNLPVNGGGMARREVAPYCP